MRYLGGLHRKLDRPNETVTRLFNFLCRIDLKNILFAAHRAAI